MYKKIDKNTDRETEKKREKENLWFYYDYKYQLLQGIFYYLAKDKSNIDLWASW